MTELVLAPQIQVDQANTVLDPFARDLALEIVAVAEDHGHLQARAELAHETVVADPVGGAGGQHAAALRAVVVRAGHAHVHRRDLGVLVADAGQHRGAVITLVVVVGQFLGAGIGPVFVFPAQLGGLVARGSDRAAVIRGHVLLVDRAAHGARQRGAHFHVVPVQHVRAAHEFVHLRIGDLGQFFGAEQVFLTRRVTQAALGRRTCDAEAV